MRRSVPAIIRVLRRLDLREGGSGCWIFTGTTGNHGYGVVGNGERRDGLAREYGFHESTISVYTRQYKEREANADQ